MKRFFYPACIIAAIFLLAGCDILFGIKGSGSSPEIPVNKNEKEIKIPVTNNKPEEVPAPDFKEKPHLLNKSPVYNIEKPSYKYDSKGKFATGETVECYSYYEGCPVLSVTAKGNGLEFTTYHDPIWWYVDIFVYNETRQCMNARLDVPDSDSMSGTSHSYFYPFVKKGDSYKIYIIKQDKNYQNWKSFEDDAVYITAIGGDGNFFISYDKYEYFNDTTAIIFDNLQFTVPEVVKDNYDVSGGIYGESLWVGDSVWPYGYKFKDSALYLNDSNDAAGFIKNKDAISVSLNYNYSYYDSNYGKKFSYSRNIIEGTIYTASINESSTMVLSGQKKIPNVYITSYSGWDADATHHFGSDWENATISIEDSDEENNISDVQIKIKDRGNSTKWTGKTPFSIKFDEKTKILGMKKAKRWVLMANYFDRSLIRTELAGYIGNEVFNSYWNAQFKPVNLYLNGRFIGTYDFGECNKIAKQRIDIQSLEDYADKKADYEDVNGDGRIDINDAGFMVEIDTAINWDSSITAYNYKNTVTVSDWGGAERIFFYSSEKCIPMTLKEPDFDNSKYSDSDCRIYGKYAKSKIDAFEKMLYSSDFKNNYTDYIDPISFIDWYLINEFSKNSDANFQKSVPVTYNAATGKLYMGPNWDFDLAFGNFNHSYNSDFGNSSVEDTKGWYIYGGRKGCDENALYCEVNNTTEVQCWWINRLMESASFRKAVKARWNDRKIFLKNAINQQIVDYANRLYDYIPQNEEIIPRLGQESWNGPSGYASRTQYEDEIYYLYTWCMARYDWMDKEIQSW